MEPPLYAGRTPVAERGPDWFWSDADQDPPAGLSTTLTFRDALYEVPR